MEYSAIILCAGSGKRTGLKYNKIFHQINGESIYQMTMKNFLDDVECKQIIVVTKKEERKDLENIVQDSRIDYIYGGKERQDSVYNGLQLVKYDYVMIHDGARPYIARDKIENIKVSLRDYDACLLMVPAKDTIKVVRDGFVEKTLERSCLMQAQTPQAFKTAIIKKAYLEARDNGFQATDDCSLVEEFMDTKIQVIEGSYQNIKITTKEDL